MTATTASTPFFQSKGGRTFLLIWFGQMISSIGSNLTGFGLGVWIYQQTGSATLFAMNMFAFTLPQIVLSPFAGALVDRLDRRVAMIVSDSGAALSTLSVAILYFAGVLQPWHILVATFFNSMFNAVQWPAWSAAQTLIVPKEHLGRAGGMVQIGDALGQLFAPAIAGVLFVTIHLNGIILIDFATFLFALTTLSFAAVPKPKKSQATDESEESFWKQTTFGWRYIVARPSLLGLLIYFATINLFMGFVGPLFGPLFLATTTPAVYGLVGSIIGVGMLAGTLVMSAWGGTKRKIVGLLGSGLVGGLFLAVAGVRFSVPLIAVAGFLSMFTMPIMNASSQAIWQSKVEPDVQGRVFSARRMIAWSTNLPALLLVGPMIDFVLHPLMASDGLLAGTPLGNLLTVGPGRDVGLAFMIMGLLMAISSAVFFLVPVVRDVETLIPDAVGDLPAADLEAAPDPPVAAGEAVSPA